MDPQSRDPQQPDLPAADDTPAAAEPPAAEPPAPPGWNQAPPAQSGWVQPQPQSGWNQGAGYAIAPPRPGGVTFAGIFLIVMGVLGLLVSLLLFLGGAAFGNLFNEIEGLGALVGGVLTVVAVIVLVWALLHLAGGIGALQGKGWGRATGIVVSVIAVILFLLGLLGSLGAVQMEGAGLGFNIAMVVLYGISAWSLMKAGPYFAARR